MIRLSILFGLATLAAGCAGEPVPLSLPVVHDLARALPAAVVELETDRLDFGTPQARPHLLAGWSYDERPAGGGEPFVWSDGPESVLELTVVQPRELAVEIVVRPAPLAPGERQAVTPVVNGRRLPAIELAPGSGRHAFALPAAALTLGINRLAFRYRHARSPAELGTGRDGRRLGVAWQRLTLTPRLAAAGAAAPRSGEGDLTLPAGQRLSFFLPLPAGGVFTVDGIEPGDAALTVSLRPEGGTERRLGTIDAGSGPAAFPVSDEPGLARLSLTALAAPGSAGGEVVLRRPAVRGREPLPPPAPPAAPAEPPRPVLASVSAAPSRPNVLIYLADTLRADRLGCYGGRRPLTPALDAFAEGALLFEHAVAQAPWTRPSAASILTGLTPFGHGVRTEDDALPPTLPTLGSLLAAAGYRTGAISANGQVSRATGFAHGFGDLRFLAHGPPSEETVDAALAWLDEGERGRPWFLYVHDLDPHAPYEPPDDLRRRFAPDVDPEAGSHTAIVAAYGARGVERARRVADLVPLYEAEVAAMDRAFGRLLDGLADRGMADDTLVVFVSDHGEEFDEHGDLGHGKNLFRPSLDVPLVVRLPGQRRGARVSRLAQHVDLLPTVLAQAGLEPPTGLPGVDLAELARVADGDHVPPRPAVSHLHSDRRRGTALTLGGWKLIRPESAPLGLRSTLYAWLDDPAESHDLARARPVRVGYLRSLLRAAAAAPEAERTPAEIDEETRRSLEALGYL